MQPIQLQWIDYTILIAYVAFVIGIGWTLARYMKTSADFLTSARSIPTWVTGLAFISANLGALELVGMAASGAKYGITTAHFYWVGAIPAMVFLAVFMMPFYYGSKARSVPEYLKMRFDERVRALNSVAFAVMTIFASGISMNALAKLLNQLLGWNYDLALWICSGVVLLYVLKGGLTSAIYTEVLQFFMIVLGFAPVVYLGLKDVGGWHAMNQSLHTVRHPAAPQPQGAESIRPERLDERVAAATRRSVAQPDGRGLFAMVFGLGFVLSFGYWCTNFLVVQRAMAAKNMTAARNTPLVAAVPKMFFPLLVIVPGMIAVALTFDAGQELSHSAAGYQSRQLMTTRSLPSKPPTGECRCRREGRHDALGKKMDAQNRRADLGQRQRANCPTRRSRRASITAVAEYDYDGVILSLVKNIARPVCSASRSRRCWRRSCPAWPAMSPRSIPFGPMTSIRPILCQAGATSIISGRARS